MNGQDSRINNGVNFNLNSKGGETKQEQTPVVENLQQTYNNGFHNSNAGGFNPTNSMASRFDLEITPVAGKVIEHANKLITDHGLVGKASSVSIGNSKIFKGVGIVLAIGKVKYLQPIVFDERNPKTIQELVEEGKSNSKILFAPAILSNENSKYLAQFAELKDEETVSLDPIVVISNNYKTDDAVNYLVLNVFKRIEAKPFNSVAGDIAKDRSKVIQSHFTVSGQDVRLQLTHQDTGATIEDLIVGTTGSMLDIDARVHPVLGMKEVVTDGKAEKIYALRPLVIIKAFNKQNTFAKFNLEYALISIIAASVLVKPDKVVSALIPNKDKGLNIGALNPVFSFFREKSGDAKALPFLKPGTDLGMMTDFIMKAITPASLGIDLEYRSLTNAYGVFGSLIDADVTAEEKTRVSSDILAAYKNVTGLDYSGAVIERSFSYPTGKLIYSNGSSISLSDIDPIWLGSRGKEDLAHRWLESDQKANSIVAKMEILYDLANSENDIEIKPESIGYKIILSSAFINELIKNGKFQIESIPVLNLGSENIGFGGISMSVTTGVESAGYSPTSNNGRGFNIIL